MTVAVFGLVITGLTFFIATFFIDVFYGVTWQLVLLGILRGSLIVTGLLFIVKAFQRVPVSIISPLSMFIMFPMLFLSWLFFGDTITWLRALLMVIMFAACISLVFAQAHHMKKITPKEGGLASRLGLIRNPSSNRRDAEKNKKSFWFGLLFLLIALSCFSSTQVITRVLADSAINQNTSFAFFDMVRPSITFFNSIVIAVVVLIIFAFLRQNPFKTFYHNMVHITKKGKRPNVSQLGIGLTDSIWLFLYLPLVAGMNLGVLNAVGRISVAMTVIFGVVFFKEKVPWYAYPLILVVIGVGIVIGFVNIGGGYYPYP